MVSWNECSFFHIKINILFNQKMFTAVYTVGFFIHNVFLFFQSKRFDVVLVPLEKNFVLMATAGKININCGIDMYQTSGVDRDEKVSKECRWGG